MTNKSNNPESFSAGVGGLVVLMIAAVGTAGFLKSCKPEPAIGASMQNQPEVETVFNDNGSALTAVIGETSINGQQRVFGSFMLSTCEDGVLTLVTAKKVEGVPGTDLSTDTIAGLPVCERDDRITPADLNV